MVTGGGTNGLINLCQLMSAHGTIETKSSRWPLIHTGERVDNPGRHVLLVSLDVKDDRVGGHRGRGQTKHGPGRLLLVSQQLKVCSLHVLRHRGPEHRHWVMGGQSRSLTTGTAGIISESPGQNTPSHVLE